MKNQLRNELETIYGQSLSHVDKSDLELLKSNLERQNEIEKNLETFSAYEREELIEELENHIDDASMYNLGSKQAEKLIDQLMQTQNKFEVEYSHEVFSDATKRQELREAGINYIIVEPSSVKDLWLNDEFGNMRRVSDISYLYKTMLIAGDLDVVELVDYIPYIDTILSQAGSFYAVSGIVLYKGDTYTDHATGSSYELNSDLDLVEV